MKLITFRHQGVTRPGLLNDDRVTDLGAIAPDMKSLISAGESALRKARDASGKTLPLSSVELLAPVTNPGKILAIGLNYAEHVAESGFSPPDHQIWFNKQWNAITGPGDVIIPAVAPDMVDYEVELCMIIGKRCRHVPAERAREVIFGYTCGNDVSVRDWQMRTTQFTMGKSFATHAPIGPCIVTSDEFGDPHNKRLQTFVNGESRQDSNTKHLIFDCYQQIAELSAAFELNPGDVIFTGTPDGVGLAMKPPQFLKAGDTMRVQIEGIGALDNTCVAETVETVID